MTCRGNCLQGRACDCANDPLSQQLAECLNPPAAQVRWNDWFGPKWPKERNEMKAEDRTKNLMTLLGWQGGTIHDACRTLGIADSHSFLYDAAEFDNDGPSFDFRRGYGDACKYRRAPWSDRIETTEYWLGAVCAVANDLGPPSPAD